jgi:hypothetical protein
VLPCQARRCCKKQQQQQQHTVPPRLQSTCSGGISLPALIQSAGVAYTVEQCARHASSRSTTHGPTANMGCNASEAGCCCCCCCTHFTQEAGCRCRWGTTAAYNFPWLYNFNCFCCCGCALLPSQDAAT